MPLKEALDKFGVDNIVKIGVPEFDENNKKTLIGSPNIFTWDLVALHRANKASKQENFFKDLDESLSSFGLEVVWVPSLSNCFVHWFIEARLDKENNEADSSILL